MNVEIIVIGDELLIGQVTDTNSGWIARELNHIGWEVTEITTVRDRSREITDALNSSFGRARCRFDDRWIGTDEGRYYKADSL